MTYETGALRECTRCHEPTTRRGGRKNVPLCEPCALAKMADNIRELHAHHGEAYINWLESVRRELAERLAIYDSLLRIDTNEPPH